jgi:hypothetical protein
VWQVPQREITSGSVTGIPSSTGPSAETADASPPALPLWANAVDTTQEADTRRVKIRVVTCSSAYQSVKSSGCYSSRHAATEQMRLEKFVPNRALESSGAALVRRRAAFCNMMKQNMFAWN